ncbi:MAG: hypothetical protein ACOYLV_17275 [Rubrivivax sp.]
MKHAFLAAMSVLLCAALAACGGGASSSTDSTTATSPADSTGANTTPLTDAQRERQAALVQAGVPMPSTEPRWVEPAATTIAAADLAAARLAGTRSPFQTIHDEVSTLLPATSVVKPASVQPLKPVSFRRLDLAPVPIGAASQAVGDPPANPAVDCPKVCATACASATAAAAAAAFAHASASACAFAQAWACVFERTAPFTRVCAWARSSACVSTFSTAFAVGFAFAHDQECRTVCSDGTVTVSRIPGAGPGQD